MNKLNNFFILQFLLLPYFLSYSQSIPNLVVAIVVDQMKYEYVDRYWDEYSNNGFKKLVNDGVFVEIRIIILFLHTLALAMLVYLQELPRFTELLEIIGNRADFSPVYCSGDWSSRTICLCKNPMKSLILETVKCHPIYCSVTQLEIN